MIYVSKLSVLSSDINYCEYAKLHVEHGTMKQYLLYYGCFSRPSLLANRYSLVLLKETFERKVLSSQGQNAGVKHRHIVYILQVWSLVTYLYLNSVFEEYLLIFTPVSWHVTNY